MSKEKLKNKNHTSHFAPHTSNRGITLIALIITIVVMLILTGVTLSVTLGDNGLVNKAKTASDEMQKAMDKEELLSMVMGAYDVVTEKIDSNILASKVAAKGWTFDTETNLVTNEDGLEIGYVDLNTGEIIDLIMEPPVEDFTLDGVYYSDGSSIEIKGDKIIDNETDEELMDITAIDDENQTFTVMIQTEVRDNQNKIIGYEPEYTVFNYDKIIENDEVTNIILYIKGENDEKYIAGWQNLNGFTTGELEGVYTTATGILNYRRLTLDPLTFSAKIENTSDGGNTWSSHGSVTTYFYYEGIYYIGGIPVKYDSQAGTIEDLNETYTKVK